MSPAAALAPWGIVAALVPAGSRRLTFGVTFPRRAGEPQRLGSPAGLCAPRSPVRSLRDAASPPGCERTPHHQTQPHHKLSEKPGGDTGQEAGDKDMASQSLDRSCLGARCPHGTLVWAWEGEEPPTAVCAQLVGDQHPEPEIWPLVAQSNLTPNFAAA